MDGGGGYQDVRCGWEQRSPRPGWDLTYTHLGGRLRTLDVLAAVPPDARTATRRRLGQVLIAVSPGTAVVSAAASDLAFFATVARKVLQRGSAPDVPPAAESILLGGAAHAAAASPADWAAAVMSAPSAPVFTLDPSIVLDPTYEQPLWDRVHRDHPDLAAHLIPQAPLEDLTGRPGGRRWVDFLLTAPWLPTSVVVELDGAQHQRSREVDASRDAELTTAGYRVVRRAGAAATEPSADLLTRLSRSADLAPPRPTAALTRLVHGPPTVTRLAAALVELIERGQLPPGAVWDLELSDPLGIAAEVLGVVLELLSDLAAVWSLDVGPVEVRTADVVLHRSGRRYLPGPAPAAPTGSASAAGSPETEPAPQGYRARIILDPFTPPHAALPHPTPDPTVIIRGTHLPVELSWLTPTSHERRTLDPVDPDVDRALRRLVRTLFGHDTFRAGQLRAVRGLLTGSDSVVLLPTGAGKSLIYHLAGLLQPGVTLVVAPIVSLIDDQERRLHADGIDRVAALHHDRLGTAQNRDRAYAGVAVGDPLFVFLTPERLQNTAFRAALTLTAERQLINLVVVDEAHCVSEWGHDFRTAYLHLGTTLRRLSRGLDTGVPPLLALTGTASPAVLRDVIRELEFPGRSLAVQRPDTFDRPNLRYEVSTGDPQTRSARLASALATQLPAALGCTPAELARRDGPRSRCGLVFVPHVNGPVGLLETRSRVRDILRATSTPNTRTPAADLAAPAAPAADAVGAAGVVPEVEVYAGAMPTLYPGGPKGWAEHRAAAAAAFAGNSTTVLVATKAFGMGIDKENIRWTVHLGFPGSIEAFAQEAGRAGRDGKPACCLIIASPPTLQRARQLLDPHSTRDQRLAVYHRGRHEDDLQQQLFFLYSSFGGAAAEGIAADRLLRQLLPAGPAGRVEISYADDQPAVAAQEKALYRLSIVGVVEDYTVDAGARRFTVTLQPFSPETVDAATLAFLDRLTPGRFAQHRDGVDAAPEALSARIRHHLALLLDTLYDTIEPARLRALAEMYALVSGAISADDIRTRILAYLADGALAGALRDLATAPAVNVRELARTVESVPVTDPQDWIGAAARQLESYPDHPLLLLIRALAEALLQSPDAALVSALAAAAFTKLKSYGATGTTAVALLEWTLTQLRTRYDGRGWPRMPLFVTAWTAAGYPDSGLELIDFSTFAAAAGGKPTHPAELRPALTRQLSRLADLSDALTVTVTGPAADAATSPPLLSERSRSSR